MLDMSAPVPDWFVAATAVVLLLGSAVGVLGIHLVKKAKENV